MDQLSVPDDLLETARIAYELEVSSEHGHEEGFKAAIAAVLWKYRLQVMDQLSDLAGTMAEELDADAWDTDCYYDLTTDGPAAILWFVKHVKDMIPPTGDL